MKKFICFLFCSFLMLFASLGVQASVIEQIPSKTVDVSIQNDVISIAPMSYLVMNFSQLAAFSTVAEIPIIQNPSVVVPKSPFRYLYKYGAQNDLCKLRRPQKHVELPMNKRFEANMKNC